MKLFKSKKGIELWIGLIMAIIVATGAAYIAFMSKTGLQETTDFLGKEQANQLKMNNQIREVDLFVKQSAKYSVYQTIYYLAEGGGNGCETYSGYALWNSETGTCYPDEITVKKKFIENFKKEFNAYLKNYPEKDISNDYDILVKSEGELEVAGFAEKNILLSLFKEPEGVYELTVWPFYEEILWTVPSKGITTSIKPSFYQKVDYDLNDYEIIKNQAQMLVSECSEELGLNDCIITVTANYNKEAIREETPNLFWNVSIDNSRTYVFFVKTDKKFLVKDSDGKVGFKDIVIKFALYFP